MPASAVSPTAGWAAAAAARHDPRTPGGSGMTHVSPASPSSTRAARALALARRPQEIIEVTRWLFALLTLVSLLLVMPAPLSQARGGTLLLAVASALYLAGSWIAGYLRRRASLAMDIGDALAILALALASPSPLVALGFVFPALWFRSLYGSNVRAVI